MITYIAYCRKSTDEKEKQVLSIDQQISELKEFAQRENLEILEFLTEAQSAKIPGRPIFNALTKRIESGEISGIVSWNPDRLARNSVDGGKIIYLLDLGKLVSLKFPTHWFENTPQGRFMLSIAFGQAKYYVDNLSQNVLRGLKYKVKQGIWPARAPMGYRNDRNTHGIVIHPQEAKVIKGAFELYATGKYALIDIGKYFFEHGIKNKISGEYANDSNLRRILMRPLYYGAMVFKGELYEAIHEPIVSKSLFDQVQTVIAHRGWYHQTKSKRYDFAFTGFIKCGYCGYSITAENRPFYFPRTHHSVSYRYYHCTKKKLPCLAKGYTREEIIEEQFRDMIQKISLSETEATKMLELLAADEKTEKQNATMELQKLNLELTETEQKLDRLLEAYLDALVDAESYKHKKNELMERQAVLKDKISQRKTGNLFWVESIREFVFCAQECAKIARAENTGHLLAQMAKKVGSKYFLQDHRIAYSLLPPYASLAASAGAASENARSDRIFAFGQSKYYVDSLSENTKRGLRQKVRRGEFPGIAPVGYINDVRTKRIVVNKEIAPIIVEAFKLYAKNDSILDDIAHFLANKGVLSRGKIPVKRDRVTFLLSDPFYVGLFRYGGDIHVGVHEPLITKKLFNAVQKVLLERSKPVTKTKTPKAFTGLLRCGICGMMITAEIQKCHVYYRCTHKSKTIECNDPFLREEALDQQLSALLETVSLRPDWAKQMLTAIQKDSDASTQSVNAIVAEKRNLIALAETKLQRILDTYLDQDIEKETYRKKKQEFVIEKKTLEESINTLQQSHNAWLEPMKEWILDASSAASIARGTDLVQKREMLKKAFGSNLTLTHQKARGSALDPWAALRAAPTSRNLVPRAGFEPAIAWLKTTSPRPLDERGYLTNQFSYIIEFIIKGVKNETHMERICLGSVYGGNFSEAAAWARFMVARREWTTEQALTFTEEAYGRTMREQLIGVPQPDLPEELPEHSLLFPVSE